MDMKMKPILYMLCGLPGSGKSTFARNNCDRLHAVIHSSDDLRKELLGNVNDQENNSDIFFELHKRIKNDLLNGKNVIYDATNINRKRRIAFLRELKNIQCDKKCIFFVTSYEVCIANNANRERYVPIDVMSRMFKSIQPPHYKEGFDDVQIVRNRIDIMNNKLFGQQNCWDMFQQKYSNYDQQNSHHTLTLADHCKKTLEYVVENYDANAILQYAAMFHDCGKPLVRSFVNHNGDIGAEAHYYNHENVSSYIIFFTDINLNDNDLLDVSLLISMHMRPYLYAKSEKAFNKDMDFLGEDMFYQLMCLHKADENSHK